MEKIQGFPISQFYDRYTTNIAKSQIGFINFIVLPSFTQVVKVFPKLEHLVGALETNKQNWTSLFDEYEKQLTKDNDQTHIVEQYLLPQDLLMSKNRSGGAHRSSVGHNKHRSKGAGGDHYHHHRANHSSNYKSSSSQNHNSSLGGKKAIAYSSVPES